MITIDGKSYPLGVIIDDKIYNNSLTIQEILLDVLRGNPSGQKECITYIEKLRKEKEMSKTIMTGYVEKETEKVNFELKEVSGEFKVFGDNKEIYGNKDQKSSERFFIQTVEEYGGIIN